MAVFEKQKHDSPAAPGLLSLTFLRVSGVALPSWFQMPVIFRFGVVILPWNSQSMTQCQTQCLVVQRDR